MSQPPEFHDRPLAMMLADELFPNQQLWRDLIAQNPARAWRRYCWLVRHSWEGKHQEGERWAAILAFQHLTGRDPGRFAADARRLIAPRALWRKQRYQAGDFGWDPYKLAENNSPFSWAWVLHRFFDEIAELLNSIQEFYRYAQTPRQCTLDHWRWKLQLPTQRIKKFTARYDQPRVLLAIALEEMQRPSEPPGGRDGANLGPFPDWDEWRGLVAAGRKSSTDMLYELELRAAKFGALHTPFNLHESMQIGRLLMLEHF
jgi:hypothetical protein